METEYLTLIYLNSQGIHVISCPENGAVYYGERRMRLFLRDESKRVLKGIRRLAFGEGMECPWAGAVHAALAYMGESCSCHQIMGMSGACVFCAAVISTGISLTDNVLSSAIHIRRSGV